MVNKCPTYGVPHYTSPSNAEATFGKSTRKNFEKHLNPVIYVYPESFLAFLAVTGINGLIGLPFSQNFHKYIMSSYELIKNLPKKSRAKIVVNPPAYNLLPIIQRRLYLLVICIIFVIL